MELRILYLPDCPNAAVLESRLSPLLAGRPDIQVSRHVVADGSAAARLGMAGSPTLLVDGRDPFARPGQRPSVSCRRYPDDHGQPGPAPTTAQLRCVLQRRD